MQNPKFVLLALAAVTCMMLNANISVAAEPVQAQQKTQTKAQKPEVVYGSQLMTAKERTEYRAKMRSLKTSEERQAFRMEHHKAMQERAKEMGKTLPDMPAQGGGACSGAACGGMQHGGNGGMQHGGAGAAGGGMACGGCGGGMQHGGAASGGGCGGMQHGGMKHGGAGTGDGMACGGAGGGCGGMKHGGAGGGMACGGCGGCGGMMQQGGAASGVEATPEGDAASGGHVH